MYYSIVYKYNLNLELFDFKIFDNETDMINYHFKLIPNITEKNKEDITEAFKLCEYSEISIKDIVYSCYKNFNNDTLRFKEALRRYNIKEILS